MPTTAINKTERAEFGLFLHRLCDEADTIARRYFRGPLEVAHKPDDSPVTIADQEIEMALVELIRRHYPDHGIFGEETQRINPQADWQWVIDPIDGTRAFIAGKPTFVTLIGLCFHGVVQLGIISQAIQKKRWMGGDSSTTLNAPKDTPTELAGAVVSTTSIPYFTASESLTFSALERACQSTLLNMDGLAYGLLASGEVHIALDSGLKPYDFAALIPVVAQAGGIITDWQGQSVTLASRGQILAASNTALHKAALAMLNHAV